MLSRGWLVRTFVNQSWCCEALVVSPSTQRVIFCLEVLGEEPTVAS
jgi:hypothetical protein